MLRNRRTLLTLPLLVCMPLALTAQVAPFANGFLHPTGAACTPTEGPVHFASDPPSRSIRVHRPDWSESAGESYEGSDALPIVRIAYIIPSNRTPQPSISRALQNGILIGREWYRQQMEQNGFEPRSFRIETEADGGTPMVHVVHVTETDMYLREDIWNRTTEAALTAGLTLWSPGEIWLLAPETHLMQADGSVQGSVALGAGSGSHDDPGVAMIGVNGVALFDLLTDDSSYDGKVIPEIGRLPLRQDVSFSPFEGTTLSSVASSWLGAMLHELGHALGLPHDFRNDENFHGNMMANGLRGIRGSLYPDRYYDDYARLTYADALHLNKSPYFNDGMLRSEPPSVSVSAAVDGAPQNGHLSLEVGAADPDGLAHAFLYLDHNRIGETTLTGMDSSFAFRTPFHNREGKSGFSIAVVDNHGNKHEVGLSVTANVDANWAPQPHIRTIPGTPVAGQLVQLHSELSLDPDDGSDLQVEWDLDDDGVFDTPSRPAGIFQEWSPAEGNHFIRIRVTDPSGAETISTPISVRARTHIPEVAAETEEGLPTEFALHQNYPNPFNPATAIPFDLPEASRVRLSVFDVLGREVAVLLDGPMPAGRHTALFEAAHLPSGVYLYRLEGSGFARVGTLSVLK